MKPLDALSIVTSATTTARQLDAEADALEWPMAQLRKGATLPPAVLHELLEEHHRSCRTLRAHVLLVAAMVAKEEPVVPTTPWWRRLFRSRS